MNDRRRGVPPQRSFRVACRKVNVQRNAVRCRYGRSFPTSGGGTTSPEKEPTRDLGTPATDDDSGR